MGRTARGMVSLVWLLALGLTLLGTANAGQQGKSEPAPQATADGPADVIAALSEAGPLRLTLLRKETADVDGDGEPDTIAYYDTNGDGVPDVEIVDLGSTGKPTVIAIRCDVDHKGHANDWAVIDAASGEVRAALLDTDGDGEVDTVEFRD